MFRQVLCTGSHGLWKPGSELSAVATANLTTLNSFGEPFMETVCKNACSGHDVARVSRGHGKGVWC